MASIFGVESHTTLKMVSAGWKNAPSHHSRNGVAGKRALGGICLPPPPKKKRKSFFKLTFSACDFYPFWKLSIVKRQTLKCAQFLLDFHLGFSLHLKSVRFCLSGHTGHTTALLDHSLGNTRHGDDSVQPCPSAVFRRDIGKRMSCPCCVGKCYPSFSEHHYHPTMRPLPLSLWYWVQPFPHSTLHKQEAFFPSLPHLELRRISVVAGKHKQNFPSRWSGCNTCEWVWVWGGRGSCFQDWPLVGNVAL